MPGPCRAQPGPLVHASSPFLIVPIDPRTDAAPARPRRSPTRSVHPAW
ncbi:hypothetical protein KCH_39450 [Kitasatospora cheerisanensis KCTC 2395]|uniref:Uncharacterized protein n=1 Tax=Kitasatospora cheerisanensis KCTC 2395 TaxID=1348663 RepID=A0A066YVZ4_9ACTN|nr:hypothetical protein KCH_39450 [Kitasatospora cheerisanensis KCTC 2395]